MIKKSLITAFLAMAVFAWFGCSEPSWSEASSFESKLNCGIPRAEVKEAAEQLGARFLVYPDYEESRMCSAVNGTTEFLVWFSVDDRLIEVTRYERRKYFLVFTISDGRVIYNRDLCSDSGDE